MSLLDRFSEPARAPRPEHPDAGAAKETDRGSHAPPAGDPTLDLDDGALDRLTDDARQALNDLQRGDVVSLTVSAAAALAERPSAEIAERFWADTAVALDLDPNERPPIRIVKERRATFAQTPQALRRRAPARTKWRNLVLAGDWTDTGFPASIESAVRAGGAAAGRGAEIFRQLRRRQPVAKRTPPRRASPARRGPCGKPSTRLSGVMLTEMTLKSIPLRHRCCGISVSGL